VTVKIGVKNLANEVTKEIELPEEVFAYPFKEHLIHVAVEAYRAGQRQGTHSTKRRGEVSGSNRKPWRQKGTGRARAGEIRSPLWRGGGTAHGPKPRSYAKDLSVAEKKNALKSALSRKLSEESLTVLESLELDSHKTAALAERLSALGVSGKALLVDRFDNENLALASRNNPRIKTVDALGVNVYDVVARGHVLVSEEALGRLVEVLRR
jgi:large subunit ribosomal protein L4